ncbi:DUF1993 family protein [Niveibacterium sp. SC-1]|uniref:DUF1993 family protein n=1 Tax=Niveibacterium sp. SC-1 TaxID=3135646 RepID=UPI00311FD54B
MNASPNPIAGLLIAQALSQCEDLLIALAQVFRKSASAAKARGLDEATLLAARLAPDMLSLAYQVRILCDGLEGAAAQLRGETQHLQANHVFNRGAPEQFGPLVRTLEEVAPLLEQTRSALAATRAVLAGQEAPPTICLRLPSHTRRFALTDFVWRYVLPNAYFHAHTCYAALRAQGIPLGKGDLDLHGTPCYLMEKNETGGAQ